MIQGQQVSSGSVSDRQGDEHDAERQHGTGLGDARTEGFSLCLPGDDA